jgi:rhodanese-related sulfurtransferase
MSRVGKIILVCEGWRDSAFARGFLVAAGVGGRTIEARTNPGGSGHDWVKTQFIAEVANVERFSEGRGVLGLLDEDGQGVSTRQQEIADRLKAKGLGSLAAKDGRCLLLPTRNLETWLYWLTGQKNGLLVAVDETTDYKQAGPPAGASRIDNEHCRPAGEWLHTLNHTQLPQGCPAMLRIALGQLREFLKAVRR